MINIRMQPTEVNKLSPKITVVGVGGAGGNAVNNMISSGLEGVDFLVCNTDAQAIQASLCASAIQLGVSVTGGLGAGARPDVGRAAAEESLDEVLSYLDGANMVFITAGMGGGTGTGAAPVIARAARERGILTVGVVTKPFHFEGSHRMKLAEKGITEMQGYVDTLIVIPNQNLFRIANEKTTFSEAFKMADGVLQSGVRGVTDLMVMPGLINLDFADIRSAMEEMGKAMMGTGEADGDKRAIRAAESAINNPLLDDVSMKGARGVIINVTGGYDMTLFEADEACNRIRDEVDPDANIIFGATFDETMEGRMRVSVVATGIDSADIKARITSSGGADKTLERARPNVPATPASGEGSDSRASVRGTAPLGSSGVSFPARPLSVPPAASSVTMPQRSAEPESVDMFEQQEFTLDPSAQSAAASCTRETNLRGARYKGDVFIPPSPVTPQQMGAGSPMRNAPGSFHTRAALSPSPAPQASAPSAPHSLVLTPPVPGASSAERRRTPSFLERITGQGWREERSASAAHQAETGSAESSSLRAPAKPMQQRLDILDPSRPASQTAEDDLDIPAFLRRQAN